MRHAPWKMAEKREREKAALAEIEEVAARKRTARKDGHYVDDEE